MKLEDEKKNIKTDKIYIFTRYKKIQEGRFSFFLEILG
ncbi:MAG: hypothetical protein CM15mP63_4830 [Gammaproteobacteria bacterium]|nr:MAG: hypothetical protein CM15mP63_4830 [Gammaproteobacteria bacterium]